MSSIVLYAILVELQTCFEHVFNPFSLLNFDMLQSLHRDLHHCLFFNEFSRFTNEFSLFTFVIPCSCVL